MEVTFNNNLGDLYYNQKNFKEAIISYTHLIQTNTNDFSLYYKRGMSYLKLSEYKDAVIDATKVIELNNTYKSGWSLLGICLFNLNNFDKAKTAFLKAKSFDNDNTVANHYLSQIHKINNNPMAPLFHKFISNKNIKQKLNDPETMEIIRQNKANPLNLLSHPKGMSLFNDFIKYFKK